MAPNADSVAIAASCSRADLFAAADDDPLPKEADPRAVDVESVRPNWRQLATEPNCWFFAGMHIAAAAAAYATRPSWPLLGLCIGLYVIRMWGITGGYHRYFSHRAYDTSRVFQFLLACLGSTAIQKGVLWWASNHRHHHKFADEPEDAHSPKLKGFWWAHCGWFLVSYEHVDVIWKYIPDLARYPELVWIDRYHYVPGALLAAGLYALGGLDAFLWGFVVSTVLLWHGTYTINSLSHMYGSQRFVCEHHTACSAKNNFILALVTLGEGWHNNHHAKANVARNGFYWYELDISYYVIKALAALGLVRNLKRPDIAFLEQHRRIPDTGCCHHLSAAPCPDAPASKPLSSS